PRVRPRTRPSPLRRPPELGKILAIIGKDICMSVKIGTGFGVLPFGAAGPEALWRYVDACEAGDVDSIWLSERIFGPPALIEPVVGVAMMAARTHKLKFGFN